MRANKQIEKASKIHGSRGFCFRRRPEKYVIVKYTIFSKCTNLNDDTKLKYSRRLGYSLPQTCIIGFAIRLLICPVVGADFYPEERDFVNVIVNGYLTKLSP